jgi:molybdopterin molybdotransferase
VPLATAEGRFLAEELVAGRAAAGDPLGRAGGRAEAIRVLTGAPMPAEPETVVMQEDCTVAGDTVTIPPGLHA